MVGWTASISCSQSLGFGVTILGEPSQICSWESKVCELGGLGPGVITYNPYK